MANGRITKPDGSVEFTCTECKHQVSMAVDDGFDFPVCATCRWLGERPWLDDATKAKLRGQPVPPATGGSA